MPQGNNCTGEVVHVSDDFTSQVTFSFIINATIVILALLVGYLSDALDAQQLNHLDRSNIEWVRTKCIALKAYLWRSKDPAGTDLRRPSASSTLSHEESQKLWQSRKQAISRFILASSDTQLVTGLAILCDGVLYRKGINVYELHIVLAQAWLASTTHLATLDALRNDLRCYGLVRDIRVGCMMLLLVLLAAAFVMCQVDWDWGTPVLLIAKHVETESWLAQGISWFINQLAWMLALLVIFGNYLIRVQDLYVNQRHSIYMLSSLCWILRGHQSNHQTHKQYFAERIRTLRFHRMLRITTSSRPMQFLLTAVHAYDGSFLSSLPGIFFCYLYGVTWNYNIFYVVPKAVPLCISESHAFGHMGYGQIIPLLLLLLPVLAAGSTYYEYRYWRDRVRKASEARRQSEAPVDVQIVLNDKLDSENHVEVTPANCFFLLHLITMSSVAVVINVGWMETSASMWIGCCVFIFIFGLELIWIAVETVDFFRTPRMFSSDAERCRLNSDNDTRTDTD